MTPADAVDRTKATGLMSSLCGEIDLAWQDHDAEGLYAAYLDSAITTKEGVLPLFDPRSHWKQLDHDARHAVNLSPEEHRQLEMELGDYLVSIAPEDSVDGEEAHDGDEERKADRQPASQAKEAPPSVQMQMSQQQPYK